MARIEISVQNTSGQETVTLPDRLGGYDVDPNTTVTIEADTQRFEKLYHNGDPKTLTALEELDQISHVTVDIQPVVSLEEGTLEEKLEAAETFGAMAGQNIRIGTATFTTSDGTTQTFDLVPEMPDGDYEVFFNFTANFESGTATDAQVPRVSNKNPGDFDLTMNATPTSDADFAFIIVGNPANPS